MATGDTQMAVLGMPYVQGLVVDNGAGVVYTIPTGSTGVLVPVADLPKVYGAAKATQLAANRGIILNPLSISP